MCEVNTVDRSVNLNTAATAARTGRASTSPPLACNYRYLLLVNAGRPACRAMLRVDA